MSKRLKWFRSEHSFCTKTNHILLKVTQVTVWSETQKLLQSKNCLKKKTHTFKVKSEPDQGWIRARSGPDQSRIKAGSDSTLMLQIHC